MREIGLDGFRLLASLFVISLHAGNYSGLSSDEIGAAIRLSGRWAVPFFFMLSGYLLSAKVEINRIAKPLCKSVIILAISTLLLLPLIFYKAGIFGGLKQLMAPTSLLFGPYFHLWYLSSTITGFLILFACELFGLKFIIPSISIFSLFLYLIAGAYNPINDVDVAVARHFSSVGFIYMGMLMRNRIPNGNFGVALCAIGFLLQEIEAHLLSYFIGKSILSPQFLIGTIPLSIGVFEVARTYGKYIPKFISIAGTNHSLPIYILHPYMLVMIENMAYNYKISQYYVDLTIVPATFFFTWAASFTIKKFSPMIHRAIHGDVRPQV